MELRHLRYFVAVAEELHFRRAAERLHVAQPAVSEQVRKLEEELGVTLLERAHQRVSLTGAGAVLLEEARHVLRLAEAARHAARTAREQETARLRIGYAASALPAAVPRALRASTTRMETVLLPGSALELIAAVRDERLDAAVIPLPTPAGGLQVMQLRDQHAVAVLPVTDPRATERSIRLDRIAPERLMVLPREANRPFYDAVIAACRHAGLAPSIVELPDDEVDRALLAVASGAGMAVLPDCVAERYTAPGARFVPFQDPRPTCATGVVTRRHINHPPTVSFLEALSRIVYAPLPTPTPERTLAAVAA